MYDPKALGADCDHCDLQGQVPVPPERHAGAKLWVIGEAPGSSEEERGQPFCGASGREFEKALAETGHTRSDCNIGNVLACRPRGGNNLFQYLRRLSRKNEGRVEDGLEPLPSPVACCRSRLLAEIGTELPLLLVGATAFQALGQTGDRGEAGLMRSRGYPITRDDGRKVLPTWHPAFVLRSRRFTEDFRHDVGKAFRHAANALDWAEFESVLDPTLSQIDHVLERIAKSGLVACDTETDGLDPDACGLRCVALGDVEVGICMGFASVERPKRIWKTPPELAAERIRNFFSRSDVRLVGQNIDGYDRPVLLRHQMPLPDYLEVIDLLPAHHVARSELPHDLGYMATAYTDAPMWKPMDHNAWTDDLELDLYCVRDVIVTARIAPKVIGQLGDGEAAAYRSDVLFREVCNGMRKAGMLVDEIERRRHAERLWKKLRASEDKAKAASGKPKLNLASPVQVRRYLFDELGLPLPDDRMKTEAGDPSTGRDTVYALMQLALPDHVRAFLDALLDFRGAARSLGKDVLKVGEVPDYLEAYVSDGDDGAARGKRDQPRKSGLVTGADGRVHPSWSSTRVVTGRLSCSSPNLANVPSTRRDPDSLRSMFVPSEGHVYVACDSEQIQLRIAAVRANDEIWLDLLERQKRGEKVDLHKTNAASFYSTSVAQVSAFQREFAKGLGYLYVFNGGARRAMLTMRQVRDPKTGLRPYAKFELDESKMMRERLLRDHPNLERWWQREFALWRMQGYLATAKLGRRRSFLDMRDMGDEDEEEFLSELVAYVVQGDEGDIMGGAGAAGTLAKTVGWPWKLDSARGMGGPGLVHHGYDSIMAEVKASRADEAGRAIQEAMTTTWTIDGRTVPIIAKPKKGIRWSELV